VAVVRHCGSNLSFRETGLAVLLWSCSISVNQNARGRSTIATCQYKQLVRGNGICLQWRTQNIFMGGVCFIRWHMVFICIWCALLWRHNLTSYSRFQTNVLAKFVDEICIFLYTRYPYFMCQCTEYKLSPLQVMISKENNLNATTQQFITAKISGCVLKQGSEIHSSLSQSSLQLQKEASLVSCRIRAVEHRKCAAGLAGAHPGLQGAHPGLQDRILLNYCPQELRMRIKYARNLSIFCYV